MRAVRAIATGVEGTEPLSAHPRRSGPPTRSCGIWCPRPERGGVLFLWPSVEPEEGDPGLDTR